MQTHERKAIIRQKAVSLKRILWQLACTDLLCRWQNGPWGARQKWGAGSSTHESAGSQAFLLKNWFITLGILRSSKDQRRPPGNSWWLCFSKVSPKTDLPSSGSHPSCSHQPHRNQDPSTSVWISRVSGADPSLQSSSLALPGVLVGN